MYRLQPLAHPELFRGIRDVRVLGAERAAVGLGQRGDDLAQRRLAAAFGMQRAVVALAAGLEELRRAGAEDGVEVDLR